MDSDQPQPPELPTDSIKRLLEDARRRLIETGTRNRLINVNRKATRANVINIVNERSDDIFDILWTHKRKMRFFPLLSAEEASEEVDTPRLTLVKEEFDETRYTDNRLETRMTPDALQKRLLRLARDAATAEGEQGVNILYLALGFLTWYEDKSSAVAREAPLILLPVELKRNARTSTYDIVSRSDDLSTNLPLKERLQEDFGISLPEIVEEDWSPTKYFNQIEEVIAARARWSIDRNGMQLGFFSFAKLLMLRDLDPKNWAGRGLETHDLVRRLLYESFEQREPLFDKEDRLDDKLEPAEIIQVVDADASQTKVIEEVRAGRNLVVQGPPGTGKSQTITNIIAAAAHDGKRVLFVAEKMAALNVVYDRLVKVGLRDVCLELHSRRANKKALLGEVGRTLRSGGALPEVPPEPLQLKTARDQLNNIAHVIHKPIGGTGETPFSAIGQLSKFSGSGQPPPSILVDDIESISRSSAIEITRSIEKFSERLSKIGSLSAHPYYGVQELSLQPTDQARLQTSSVELSGVIEKLDSQYKKVAAVLNISALPTLSNISELVKFLRQLSSAPDVERATLFDIAQIEISKRVAEGLELGQQWQQARRALEDKFSEVAWSADVTQLRMAVANGQNSFLTRLGPKYRRAGRQLEGLLKEPLPKSAEERLDLVDGLIEVQSLRSRLKGEEGFLGDKLGGHWRSEQTAFSDVLKVVEWAAPLNELGFPSFSKQRAVELALKPEQLSKLIENFDQLPYRIRKSFASIAQTLKLSVEAVFDDASLLDIPLENLAAYLTRLSEEQHRYDEWVQLELIRKKLLSAKLSPLLDNLESGRLSAKSAGTEFLYARAEAIWNRGLQEIPSLKKLANFDRQKLVRTYQDLEQQRFADTKAIIVSKHLEQLPQGAAGDMAVIRGELGKKRAHKPIRKLMTQAAEGIQRIKPVFLMSPISVAQFLPPEKIEFDLLVIDEASQVRPEDSLGAVARCKQIVVVGDQKQLPPTAFFDRLTSNSEDDDEIDTPLGSAARASELESILSLCEARGLPPRMLEWHYRSRDPSLIAVSNNEFYDHNLILPPSPLQNDQAYGLVFTKVNGVYDRGGRRTNRIEAEAVVRRVCEHAITQPSLSLGIVTFSSAQRDMMTELLEFERRTNPQLDAFLRDGKREDVFVKNIENVQGDERDVILVTVGYGPDQPGGRLTNMSFGPINKDGGERRLNVLFTRARLRCEIFASFEPGDIDHNRVQKIGPKVLKKFLEFAKTGILDERAPVGKGADSPFEEDVADVIRNLGYEVDHQVGSAGFLIDLGVRHADRPGQYILAVECDGATYHSALWARERDRLRQGVLEHLGWQFHRIWSTDWFYRRAAEIERLRLALERARTSANETSYVIGTNEGYLLELDDDELDDNSDDFDFSSLEQPTRQFPYYERFSGNTTSSVEPHEVSSQVLAQLVARIVATEGPIHQDEIARRLASSFRKERAGRRIVEATNKALLVAKRIGDPELGNEEQFWFTIEQEKNPPIRDRSMESGTTVKAEYLAPLEIEAALTLAKQDNVGASSDDLIRAASRMMGFKRAGPDIVSAFAQVLNPTDRTQ